jgi:3-phosphoshikimate 1-carboxyvinyltransferase
VRFLDVLEEMGCSIVEENEGVSVSGPSQLRGISVDMGDISDTAITLACIAPYADTPTIIRNIGHIRLQESDRITALASNLERMGIRTEVGPDFLTVHPGATHGIVVDPFGDHRIAMAFSIMGLVTPDLGVSDPGCVAKTCPEYYDLLDRFYESSAR